MVKDISRSRPKVTPAVVTVELRDPKSDTLYTVDQDFVDKVLDFKSTLGGRQPTRYELKQLMLDKQAETIEQELINRTTYRRTGKRPNRNPIFRKVSVHGGYWLALSRGIGRGSSETGLDIMGANFSRHTMPRWELLLASNIILCVLLLLLLESLLESLLPFSITTSSLLLKSVIKL